MVSTKLPILFFVVSVFFKLSWCLVMKKDVVGPSCQVFDQEMIQSDETSSACSSVSRRVLLREAGKSMAVPLAFTALPSEVSAAQPVTIKETDSLGAMARRKLRPKPPKCLRRKLFQDFAVLLMRSSYNSLDLLDCVAMDQFQRDFFLIRSSEYESYVNSLGPGLVQQGDLTDPYYFDFISFAQYEVINREISNNPPLVFEEQQPVDQGEDKPQKFVPMVVKRDPKVTNEMLGPEHSRMVGTAILKRLEEVFGGTDVAVPKIEEMSKPDSATMVAAIRQLMNLFLVNGYAFEGSVAILSESTGGPNASGTKIRVTLSAPAIFWGAKILQNERAPLSNDFFQKAVEALVSKAGYRSSFATKFEGTNEELTIAIL